MNNYDSIVSGALDLAHTEALKRKHSELTEHHLLWGLINHPSSTTSNYLKGERKIIKGLLEKLPTLQQVSMNQIRPSSKFSEWLTLASSNAIQAGRDAISEADLLKHFKQFYPQIQMEAPEDLSDGPPDFLINLNDLANQGKLDPVIGRSKEIRKVQEILCRRTKNNPVLVGAPGVGKTAIVEGLAGLIQANQVPDVIVGNTIYSLNMGSLMAGTKYRGEFEERIESLLTFLKEEGRDAIIFIDEIHLLIGAGKTEGAMDAANLLKPALARGELNCIGATTIEEYKKYIETDSALERRFCQVQVHEPTKEDTIQILMGLKEKLEIHHGIEITEDAIVAASYYSDQYISDRFLPDKAIDIIDEGSAGLKLSADSMPPELVELDALIRSKKILASSKNSSSKLENQIQDLEEEYQLNKKEWDKKTRALREVSQLKIQLDKAQFKLQKAQQEGDYEAASKLMYHDIPEMEEKLKAYNISWKLTRNEVADVISRSTGVPVERILKTQQENMLNLEKALKEKVFGQDEAIQEVSDTLIAAHAGLSDQTRPMGSFLLLGPSGVGKTETAKALAQYLFQSDKHLIRIDLSEYSEQHAVAKLIGAPPGYIGYEKGGILTEAVRRNPYCVILFDEVEKAHINFSDILLQILDDGRLTDTQGRVVNFKNTIIFITSNLKDHENYLKPEVIGRLDSVLHYQLLEKAMVEKLIEQELQLLNDKLTDRHLKIRLDKTLKQRILDAGYDEKYGARPLKTTFNRMLVRPLSKLVLRDKDLTGDLLASYNKANQLELNNKD